MIRRDRNHIVYSVRRGVSLSSDGNVLIRPNSPSKVSIQLHLSGSMHAVAFKTVISSMAGKYFSASSIQQSLPEYY